ncbi:unnamed protein product [Clonostachys rhizophaga]|uniref:Copper acquisition factor BIM1-like domain-containing protein n=1 Tax=Clonostachys rhizophaga TaxID=160324 RepID=A0A9N9VKV5_9HYPO|nr:unnamed protein product [Clonostachys rhizophaga]
MRATLLLGALSALGLTNAHFTIKSPKGIGSADSTADHAPCGGFTPDLSDGSSQLVDIHVGGEAVALRLTHSRCTWLLRATLDSAAKNGWEKVYPITVQSGLGDYCFPAVTFPSDWAGKKGVISIVSSADDGQLFQCIAANFVSGTASPPTTCTNASSVTSYSTDDSELQKLIGDQDSASSTASSSAASPSATDSKGAAGALLVPSIQSVGSLVAGVGALVLGGALMI